MTENRLTQYWSDQQAAASYAAPRVLVEPNSMQAFVVVSVQDLYRMAQQQARRDYQLNLLFNAEHYRDNPRG